MHVDNLKVLYKDQTVLDNFLDELRSEFGQEDELTENRRPVHKYLSNKSNHLIAGKVVCTMFDYLEDMIVECTEEQLFLLFRKQSII